MVKWNSGGNHVRRSCSCRKINLSQTVISEVGQETSSCRNDGCQRTDGGIRHDQITSHTYIKAVLSSDKKELVRHSRRGMLHTENKTLESVTGHFAVIRFAAIM